MRIRLVFWAAVLTFAAATLSVVAISLQLIGGIQVEFKFGASDSGRSAPPTSAGPTASSALNGGDVAGPPTQLPAPALPALPIRTADVPQAVQMAAGSEKAFPANTVVSGDVYVNGVWTTDSEESTGQVLVLTRAAIVAAPYGATVVVGVPQDRLTQVVSEQTAATISAGCVMGCSSVSLSYAP
jgi:hypothetical protein